MRQEIIFISEENDRRFLFGKRGIVKTIVFDEQKTVIAKCYQRFSLVVY